MDASSADRLPVPVSYFIFVQAECIEGITQGASLTLTLGPPGTGKTTVIAATAWALTESVNGGDVTILTQTVRL